jgi:hypothetical protein
MKALSIALVTAVVATAMLSSGDTRASSSASSASSEGSSASVGSLSTSLEKSSDSSSKGDKVAAGDYKVIQMADATDRPGVLRVTLQATADASNTFVLLLPQAAATQGQVALGAVIQARPREFGLEFAAGTPRQPFYLVLHDAAYRELRTQVVTI